MKKQTALQWFIEQIENHNGVTRAGFQKCIDEALQMEKEQIVEGFNFGVYDGGGLIKKYKMSGEQYYNESYLNS
jgi:Mor family transcriptional regulator